MKITGFIWLEDIVDKIVRKHSVKPEEVHELFLNDPRFRFVEKGHRKDENVYATFGQTNEGRYLICFFVHKKDDRALIISARDMTRAERKIYGRK
jgi:uncharacterized DUF497 family protein